MIFDKLIRKNRVMKALIHSFIVLFFITPATLFSQETNPQVRAVKNGIKMFVAEEPKEIPEDRIIENSEFTNTMQVDYNSDRILPLVDFDEFNNGYTEYDGKEYPMSSIDLVIDYTSFPMFTRTSVWMDIAGIQDSLGNDIMLSMEDYEEYMELGLIDEGFGFAMPGQSSTTLRFNKDMTYGDKIVVDGKVGISYPKKVDFVLLEKDNREEVEINEVKYQIIEMKGNMVTMKVSGNRRNMEQNELHVLNAEGKLFQGMSSIGISEAQYNMYQEYGLDIPDEVVSKYLESVNFADMNISQVKKITIEGTADKVFIFRVTESGEVMIPVKIEHVIRW